MSTNKSTEVVRIMNDDILANMKSFKDALEATSNVYGNVLEAGEILGNGFHKIDKKHLVGVGFIIVDYKFQIGEFGEDYVFVQVVTVTDKKVFFTDGSTGIREQLRVLQGLGIRGGVLVPNGLAVSEYEYEGKPAVTYYLAQ